MRIPEFLVHSPHFDLLSLYYYTKMCFYLRRQLAAGQVMGNVVGVIVLIDKTFLNISKYGHGWWVKP